MFTLEEKVNICLRFIATTDIESLEELGMLAAQALKEETTELAAPENTIDLDDLINGLLIEIGTPPNLRGYDVIICALKLILSDKEYLHDITFRLYGDIATLLNTTRTKVERNIRHAIEVSFDRGDISRIREIFGNTVDVNKGKLTNSQFLAFCERELRRRMK